jgi:hypothetical protein
VSLILECRRRPPRRQPPAHARPPRTTPKSHRPRASNRTIVGIFDPKAACHLAAHRGLSLDPAMDPTAAVNFAGCYIHQGGKSKISSPSRRGIPFSLDFPLHRTPKPAADERVHCHPEEPQATKAFRSVGVPPAVSGASRSRKVRGQDAHDTSGKMPALPNWLSLYFENISGKYNYRGPSLRSG